MATERRKYRSRVSEGLHQNVSGLYRAGVIGKLTMREFDVLCLTTVEPMTPSEIRALRKREKVSQILFAMYLNVRKDAVSKWERGEKRPAGPALKLLNLVRAKGLDAIA
jgi:putative transcriptional regulator